MDNRIFEVLDILGDYDTTLNITIQAFGEILEDLDCDSETACMAEGLIVAIIMDKGVRLIPEDPQTQEEVLSNAPGLEQVYATLPESLPLIYEVALGYAIALSQSRWAWRPWERVRNFLLEWEDDPETTH